jgi:hypothetical protein
MPTSPKPPVACVIPLSELHAAIDTNPLAVFETIMNIMQTVEYMTSQIENEQFMDNMKELHRKEVVKIVGLFEACNIAPTGLPEKKDGKKTTKLDPGAVSVSI